MKNRLHVALIVLLAATLACANPLDRGTIYVERIKVFKVAVAPPSGTDSFTLSVGYQTCIDCGQAEDNEILIFEIHCSYVAPDMATMEIGTFYDDLDYGEDEGTWYSTSRELKFTVRKPDGSILPGTYLAGCSTLNSPPVTASFTVVEEGTVPTEPPVALPQEPPKPPVSAPLKGKIIFDYANAQSSRPSGGGELDRVTKWCIPEVTITPDGIVGGTCEFFGTTDLHESTVKVHVTGIAVQGGSFNFTYDVTEKGSNGWNLKPGENPSVPVWSNEAKWEISYTGSGNFTSATQASGTATFNYSCDSGAGNLFWCNSQTSEAFSGTVLWSFVAIP